MKLADYLGKQDILPELAANTRDEVLAELVSALKALHPSLAGEDLLQILSEREMLGSTGIGDGIAIPHGKLRRSADSILLLGRSRKGVNFGALDGKPVHLFFVLLAPQSASGVHLKVLARISRIVMEPDVRRELLAAPDPDALYHTIIYQDSRH